MKNGEGCHVTGRDPKTKENFGRPLERNMMLQNIPQMMVCLLVMYISTGVYCHVYVTIRRMNLWGQRLICIGPSGGK
jgi:hypothetical protein